MDTTEENVQTLLGMGFYNESKIRRALQLAKNDLNEAVSYLTCEMPMTAYDPINDVDMHEIVESNDKIVPAYPPTYEEATNTNTNEMQCKSDEEAIGFPYEHLVELEGRVFTDNWSIPFRKDESLAKCIIASTKLVNEGWLNIDDNCTRFLDRCMPECFNKLLTSSAVQRWLSDVQEGIYDMLVLFVDLLIARLKHSPLPLTMLEILSTAFNPDCAWNVKNKYRPWTQTYWTSRLGGIKNCFARPPEGEHKMTRISEQRGWMVSLINVFCEKGGLDQLKDVIQRINQLDASQYAALLQPFSACADWLNRSCVHSSIEPIIEHAVKYVKELSEDDFKLKKLSSLSELLSAMKGVCRVMWPDDVSFVDDLRLEVTLRMIKSPHFNAKMNALKEVTKLIDESDSYTNLSSLDKDKILDWLVENTILKISLDGHIDQSQYCDKIRKVVEFIGDKLSSDELTQLWKLQNNASLSVSENIQSILSGAAPQFTEQQLDLLFSLIHKSWLGEDERARRQLVSFIGRIGHNSKLGRDIEKVLTLLWDLAHLPKLSPHLVELALHEHQSILSDSYLIKDTLKKNFIVRCIEDIRKDQWIVPALRQMTEISKTIIKSQYKSNKSDRSFLHDLNRSHDVVKLIVTSLMRCHQMAVDSSRRQDIELCGELLVDDRYKHSEFVWWHLSFLKFLLKEGDLFLSQQRAKDLWDTLFVNKDACAEDRETCCDWFICVLNDLEPDALRSVFKDRLTRVDVHSMDVNLFNCFIAFFENVNVSEQKAKKSQGILYVEKLELVGIEFLWKICLEVLSSDVANNAISSLVRYSYMNVSQKLKKDVTSLHSKFLNECYKRLNACHTGDNGSTIAEAVNIATKTLAANVMPDVAAVTSSRRTNKYLTIERLLCIVYAYITDIESSHTESRTVLPHGEFYRGAPITLEVRPEAHKQFFTIETHGNETVRSIRRRIANEIEVLYDHVQILANDRTIPLSNDRLLLDNCGFSGNQVVYVKTISSVVSAMQVDDETSFKSSALSEMEQRLPSFVLAKLGCRVFDILFQLSDLDQSQITSCVRKLLLLLPTDQRVRRAIESADLGDSDSVNDGSNSSDSASSMSTDSDQTMEGLSIDGASTRKQKSFECLFRLSSPDMNLFRLRYNLEVLSGLLMPVNDELQQAAIDDSGSFMYTFIRCGGVQSILDVLQREIVSESVDQFGDAETRRGCYAVSLNIAKFLLCVAYYCDSHTDCGQGGKVFTIGSEAAVSPMKRDSFRVGSTDASATPTKRNRKSISQSPVVIPYEIPHIAKTSVQIMNGDEFSSLIFTLLRITWFASACRLEQLTANADLNIEGTAFTKGRRWSRESTSSNTVSPFRHASTSSVSSSGSTDVPEPNYLVKSDESCDKNADSVIARQALELLVSCLKLRSSHLECFFELPCVSEFIVDILTRPTDAEVRDCAVEQLYKLSCASSAMVKTPRQRLMQILVKARVPYWHQTTVLRAKAQLLVRHCLQYFALRGKLLRDCISDHEQKSCGVDEVQNLQDELSWLNDFEIPTSAQYAESSSARCLDNLLLTGHLRLIKILVSSPKVNKKEIGSQLIGRLLSDFLFPASKLILDDSGQPRSQRSIASYLPKCSTDASRSAAFDVLVELCRECTENLSQVASQLITMHHYADQARAKEFDFSPLVLERPDHGFVGLKNGGATCYMNSVLQQLYMVPDIAQLILGTDIENENDPEHTVLYQLQKVFANLHHSRLQFHIPNTFWKTFKLWGQDVNIREQQDAFEFFTDLTDQIDEYLRLKDRNCVFRNVLQGFFSDQKICEDCPHRYEREEPYFALNLPVKSGSLEDSLRQFVAGEKLEGDNAYFCEKCNEKRTTLKRTCIKSLPPILTIQLKRFGYDWEANRSMKFDYYFKFPHEVDMQPYLHDSTASLRRRHRTCDQQLYRLVGIVIHSGQAQSGHYYSIIKDRRGSPLTNPHHGRWFKFNDTTVEEFDMNDRSIEDECFGGTFTTKVYEKGLPYDEQRVRFWNAYLLFYEKVPDVPTVGKGRVSFMRQTQVINSGFSSPEISPPSSPRKVNDIKLSQLTNLIKKGDQRGIFTSQIPSSIMQLVREENLQFMRNRGIYSPAYFAFIARLVQANLHCTGSYPAIAVTSLQLATRFLFQTYFRTKRSLQTELDDWQAVIEDIFATSPPACVWFTSQLHSTSGLANVVSFLLECPNEMVRSCFAKILGKALQCLLASTITKEQRKAGFEPMLLSLLSLLDREVAEHVRRSEEFFTLLAEFSSNGAAACQAIIRHNGFARLLKFLLGPTATLSLFVENQPSKDGSGDATPSNSDVTDDVVTRRWSSVQSRDFLALHSTIANVILHTDFSKFRAPEAGDTSSRLLPPVPRTVAVHHKIPMSSSVERALTGKLARRYVREMLFAAREISSSVAIVSDIILHCCYKNEEFSTLIIDIILDELWSVSANELKSLLVVLLDLLSFNDTLHRTRLKDALEREGRGFLHLIKETQRDDEPKCYQCVKSLVQLATRSESSRQFLLEISSSWSWSVAWLKRKMSEHSWTSQSNRSNEASTSKQFQRTMSAQHTLEEATALLAATRKSSGSTIEDEPST